MNPSGAQAPDMRAPRATSIWRNPRFRVIWGGQTASIFGDRVTGIALLAFIFLAVCFAGAALLAHKRH